MNTVTDELYTQFSGKVKRYIAGKVQNPSDAEELVNDVFLKAIEGYKHFDSEKSSLSTWIYTITRNTVIDYYRTKKLYSPLDETYSTHSTAENDFIGAEQLSALAKALESLDSTPRDIIILRYYSGLTLKQIAERLGISYSYAKLLHGKALSELKKQLVL